MGGIIWWSDEGDICCRIDNCSVYISSSIRILVVTRWIKDLHEIIREGYMCCSNGGWCMLSVDNYSVCDFFNNIRIRVVTCWIKDLEIISLSNKRETFIWCSDEGDVLSGWQLFCLWFFFCNIRTWVMLHERSFWDYWFIKFKALRAFHGELTWATCQVDNYSSLFFIWNSQWHHSYYT